jgi:trimeric autotransporter adhesin
LTSTDAIMPTVAGTGTTDFLPLWTNSTGTLGNSILFQSGTGSTAKVGINTTAPAVTLDVNGSANVHGVLSLAATGNATASGGKNSAAEDFVASAFNSSTSTAVPQKFQWQAEPVSNDTASASGALSLLYASGSAAPAETGLKITSKGVLTFAAGQTFPGTGKGSVTSVGLSAPSSDFTVSGSPVAGSGTIALNWKTAPTNANTANAIVKRDGSGGFNAGAITATSTSSGGTAVSANAGSSSASNGVIAYGATGVAGYTTVANSIGVYGDAGSSGSSQGVVGYGATGVSGYTTISGGTGVYAYGGTSTTSNGVIAYGATGMAGYATVAGSIGVFGNAGTSAGGDGVYGTGDTGVYGTGNTDGVYGSGNTYGVYGTSGSYGIYGTVSSSGVDGVHGVSASENSGVAGINDNATSGWGVYGQAASPSGVGGGFYNTSSGDALFAENQATGSFAAFFLGNVDVDGNLSKASGSFKIDDPIDPANKYLYHSFVESPDMMNVYNGNVTTDAEGNAVVQLPEWFESLNRDFRYQLTVLGQFAQAIVAGKVANHQFAIKTDKPNVEVSWQVTGIRQDAWANAHRIPVEVEKSAADRGLYLHPELFGAPAEKSIALAHHPTAQKLHKPAVVPKIATRR